MTVEELAGRVDALERRIAAIEVGSVRLGPSPKQDPGPLEIAVMRRRLAIDAPPVDRSQQTLTDGSPVTPDYREIDPVTGQQKGYVVLSDAERAKGFVRPVRRTYRHTTCGSSTTMGPALAETYARDPGFYSGTFCATCRAHFPLEQFAWEDGSQVGS